MFWMNFYLSNYSHVDFTSIYMNCVQGSVTIVSDGRDINIRKNIYKPCFHNLPRWQATIGTSSTSFNSIIDIIFIVYIAN